jgi:molybdopterin-binding protein
METSARNQLKGTVMSVSLGEVMAEVSVDVNGAQVVAAITKESAERLGLAEGKPVVVIVKATDVMIGIAPV